MMKIFEVFGYPPIGQKGSAIADPQHFSHHDKYVPDNAHGFNRTHLKDYGKFLSIPLSERFMKKISCDPPDLK